MLFLRSKKDKQGNIKKAPAQNPRILEVNLIKGEVHIPFDWKRHLAIFLLTIIVAAAFIAEIYFGLNLWAKQEMVKADKLTAEITVLSGEVKAMQEKADAALLYKAKSSEVSRLLDQHIYWTNFFAWLEANTLSTVKFSGFSGDTEGTYTLEATTGRYQEVSWQVKALLDSPVVKKASVLQVSSSETAGKVLSADEIADLTEDEEASNQATTTPGQITTGGEKFVNFSLSLEINPDIFKK